MGGASGGTGGGKRGGGKGQGGGRKRQRQASWSPSSEAGGEGGEEGPGTACITGEQADVLQPSWVKRYNTKKAKGIALNLKCNVCKKGETHGGHAGLPSGVTNVGSVFKKTGGFGGMGGVRSQGGELGTLLVCEGWCGKASHIQCDGLQVVVPRGERGHHHWYVVVRLVVNARGEGGG